MVRGSEPARFSSSTAAGGGRSLGVAVIDPVPIFRDGLASLVHRTPGLHWAGHAASHHAALQLCEQIKPDVVVLDSALDPHFHLTRLLGTADASLVIVTLIRDCNRTPQYLATSIASGVHAVLPRAADPRRLGDAIRLAHTDRRYLDPTLAALISRPKRQPPGHPSGQSFAPRSPMPLSRREYEVLQLLAEGLENSGIAKTLFLSVETVRTHVKSILRKLSARDRTHAVTIAFRSGILIVHPDMPYDVSPVRRSATPAAPMVG
jgi:DNA-binding NarL/FixJ family response regulator